MPVDVERYNRLIDLACKIADRWLIRYVNLLHTPCHSCGARPIDNPEGAVPDDRRRDY